MKGIMKDYGMLNEFVVRKHREAEDECIRRVVRQALNREPTVDDLKLFFRASKPGELGFDLFYKAVHLGHVDSKMDPANRSVEVEFTPNPDFVGGRQEVSNEP